MKAQAIPIEKLPHQLAEYPARQFAVSKSDIHLNDSGHDDRVLSEFVAIVPAFIMPSPHRGADGLNFVEGHVVALAVLRKRPA